MTKVKLSERVDFTYFIGAIISLIFFNVALFLRGESGLPMIFSLVCFGSYIGVIIRGLFDRNSWGKTPGQMKLSALVGFSSIFVIWIIESILLLIKSSRISQNIIEFIIMIEVVFLIILFVLLYKLWFRKINYYSNSKV